MKKGIFFIFLATILFSSMEVAIKFSNGAFNPIQLNLLRFTLAGMFLFPIARNKLKNNKYKLKVNDFLNFAITGFLCVVLSMTCYTWSMNYITSAEASVLFCSNTFFAIIFAVLIIGEYISKPVKVGLAISFLGILIMVNPIQFKGSVFGIIIIVISAILFGFYSVYSKSITRGTPLGGSVITCGTFFMGVLELLILVWISNVPEVAKFLEGVGLNVFSNIPIFENISLDLIPLLLYVSICVSGLGFVSYFLAIEYTSVTMASLVYLIKPMFAPFLSWMFLGETLQKFQLVGILFILIGSIIVFVSRLKVDREVV